MEFCDAGSILSIVNREPLTENQISVVMRDMLTGLAYLHERRLIHRDIKADNVLLTTTGHAKLGNDFYFIYFISMTHYFTFFLLN